MKGTNRSVLTIHTNGTYDFVCSDYYLSTKDYPALKALLIMAMMNRKIHCGKDGAKALGPISLSFNADTYSVSGGTLTLGNKNPSTLKKSDGKYPLFQQLLKAAAHT